MYIKYLQVSSNHYLKTNRKNIINLTGLRQINIKLLFIIQYIMHKIIVKNT